MSTKKSPGLAVVFYDDDTTGEVREMTRLLYHPGSMVPPLPRREEILGIHGALYRVNQVIHYFEGPGRQHEVAVMLRPMDMVDDVDQTPSESATTQAVAGNTEATGQVACAYCGDVGCPGMEECQFYDGTISS